jgi:PHS family inorganic phosphate transporter-like MFS transporter
MVEPPKAVSATTTTTDDHVPLQTHSSTTRNRHSTAFRAHFRQWRNLKVLLGCALSWFFLDVAFYGLGLNQALTLQAAGFAADPNASPYETLFTLALGSFVIAMAGSVPGYWLTVFLVDRWGRKPIQ